jgi:hypothetical protein
VGVVDTAGGVVYECVVVAGCGVGMVGRESNLSDTEKDRMESVVDKD